MLVRLIKPFGSNGAKMAVLRRWLATSVPLNSGNSKQLADFNPNNYSIPLRPVTMNDLMEPYGSWKVAYAAECKKANRTLALGIISCALSVTFLIQSGVFDAGIMPNLDNVMEETHPFEFDKTDRITV